MESKIPSNITHCCEYVLRDQSCADDDVNLTIEEKEILLYRRLYRNYQSCCIEWGLFLAALRKAYMDTIDNIIDEPPNTIMEEQIKDCRSLVNIVSIMPTMELAMTFLKHNLLETLYPRTFAAYYFVLILRVPAILQNISYEEFERESKINFALAHMKLPVYLIQITYDANSCKEQSFLAARGDDKTSFVYVVNNIADCHRILSSGLDDYICDLPNSLLEFSTQLSSLPLPRKNDFSTSNGGTMPPIVTVYEVKEGYQKISNTHGSINAEETELMQIRYLLVFDEFGEEAPMSIATSTWKKISTFIWPVSTFCFYLKLKSVLEAMGKLVKYAFKYFIRS